MQSLHVLACLVFLVVAPTLASGISIAVAARWQDEPIAAPRDALSADEILKRLHSEDIQQVQDGVGHLWRPPSDEWDDATLRRMVAALADVAHRPIRPRDRGPDDGVTRWPAAALTGVGEAMLRVGTRVPDALLVATRHPTVEARLRAIDALRSLPSLEARDRFVELLADPDAGVRLRAVNSLDWMKPCGFQQHLAPLLQDSALEVRRRVARLLATCGSHDAMAVLAETCDGSIDDWAHPPVAPSQWPRPDCIELPALVTRNHAAIWWEARFARLDGLPLPEGISPFVLARQPSDAFSWKLWWSQHGSGVDMLAENMALLTEPQPPKMESRHRSISATLLERALDEQGLRRLQAVPPEILEWWGVYDGSLDVIRARLAPGSLAATILRRDLTPIERGRALERLFRVDCLRARSLQLRLFESPDPADVETALSMAGLFPPPPPARSQRHHVASDPPGP